MKRLSVPALLWCVLAALVVSGCETIANGRKIDYKAEAAKTLPTLEVPPDLAVPPGDADAAAKGAPSPGATTYSEYTAGKNTEAAVTDNSVLPEFADVRIARDGNMRWLVVQATPDALWPKVREFVLANGLLIAKESPQTGVIETDWAENRAQIGTSVQRVLAKWLSSLYSTGTRDRYRFRLERGVEPGTTDVYITQQGMEEVEVENKTTGDTQGTMWQPRPNDPGLEMEMMRLLMVSLGTKEEQAKAQIAAATAKTPERARLTRGDGAAALSLQDDLDRAWRRVGLSLDRLGFTVEDRDRSKGVYFVRYIDPDTAEKKGGWFSSWFGKGTPKPKDQFQIHLKEAATGTDVEVLDKSGAPDKSETSDRILSLLYEQLK
jgi:outer membrane protein assembly factor BamC